MRALLRQRQQQQLGRATERSVGRLAGPSAKAQLPTVRQRLTELRRELNTLVAMAHHRTDRPHGAIHQEVRTACGGPPTAMATVEDLEKRIAYLRSR